MIRVAMILRSTAFTVKGGDTIQAEETARGLAEHGVHAELKLAGDKINYADFDLLHFFNLTRPSDILYHIKRSKKPFVVSPVLIDYSEYDRGHRKGIGGTALRFLSADAGAYLKTIARGITGTDRVMSMKYIRLGQRKSILEVIKKTALFLPNSASEYERIKKTFGRDIPYKVVFNGINEDVFCYNENRSGGSHEVLCVARIEGIKNQLNLIRALNDTAYQLTIIGAPAPNQLSYYKACRRAAAGNIRFVAHIPHRELAAYYHTAAIHILPSWFETTGLSSLEAAASGCRVIITDRGDAKEYFGSDAVYCDPSSPESIYAAVTKAASLKQDKSLSSKILSSFTWKSASRQTAEAYKKVLNRP